MGTDAMGLVNRFFSTVLLAALPALAAAEGWYNIEVLVFSQKVGSELSESQPIYPGYPLVENAVFIRAPYKGNEQDSYLLTEKSQWNLLDTALNLKADKRYQPLVHRQWRQYLPKDKDTFPVRLSGAKFDVLEMKEAEPISLYRSLSQKVDRVQVDSSNYWLPPYPYIIDGTISIQRARYLQVNVDLLLQRRDDTKRLKLSRMREERRMRSNELHYIDHPDIGVLVRITPEAKPS